MSFPPQLRFPYGIDDDYTLFHVHNTSETIITAEAQAYGAEISIRPVSDDAHEIWADNGFANLDGELIYYDSVEKNTAGKVIKLIECGRGLGGTSSKTKPVGTWIRGYVLAEHHMRLVDALIAIENRLRSIDQELDELLAEDTCEDDSSLCPDIQLDVEVIDNNETCHGIEVTYNLSIDGTFTGFRIDFGDGTFTTTRPSGTHVYPPNSSVDPIATVENGTCQIVQTAASRENPNAPPRAAEPESFGITVPVEFNVDINIPELSISNPSIEFPPLVQPCTTMTEIPNISIGGISIPEHISIDDPGIPSVISFTNLPEFVFPSEISINFPSIPDINVSVPTFPTIEFGATPDIPTTINFGAVNWGAPPAIPPVTFGAAPTIPPIEINADIPSTITISGDIPEHITVTGDIPTSISVDAGGFPSSIAVEGGVSVDWSSAPGISVDWGTPPTVSCVVTVECPSAALMRASGGGGGVTGSYISSIDIGDFDEKFIGDKPESLRLLSDDLNAQPKVEVDLGIADLGIPSEIKIVPPTYFPEEIIMKFETPIPDSIDVSLEFPDSIPLALGELKEGIQLVSPEKLPDINVIGIPSEINVVGMPSVIKVDVNIPKEIEARLTIPDDLEVPLVYKGKPIPIEFTSLPGDDEDDGPCFKLVACKP